MVVRLNNVALLVAQLGVGFGSALNSNLSGGITGQGGYDDDDDDDGQMNNCTDRSYLQRMGKRGKVWFCTTKYDLLTLL